MLQVALGVLHERDILYGRQPIIAADADQTTEHAGLVVMVYDWLREFLAATATAAILSVYQTIEVLKFHSVGIETVPQGSGWICSIEDASRICVHTNLAPASMSIYAGGIATKFREWLYHLTDMAFLFAKFRLWQQLDGLRPQRYSLVAADLAMSSYAQSITRINAKFGEVLIDVAGGTYFHSTTLPQIS